MSIEVNCKQCGAVHHVNDRLAGRHLRCPHCDAPVDVAAIAEAMGEASDLEEVIDVELVDEVDSEVLDVELDDAGLIDDESLLEAAVFADQLPPTNTPTARRVAEDAPPSTDDDDDVLPARIKPDEGELDMTPMVDVTFLLLIFFMITAAFSLQKSIESPRQTSDKPSNAPVDEPPEELDMVTVQINEFGSFLVMAPDWEKETPGKQNLIRALRDAMGDGTTPMKLVIEVHEMAKLKSLVDCMDAGTICDYGEMQVLQVEGFE